ncbi:MAG: hypothetical protein ABIY46_07955 [Gemmatimonadales bacterium]
MAPATTTGPAVSVTGPTTAWNGPRETRLRPEHAHRYPWVRPGCWESAAMTADRVVAGSLLCGRAGTSLRSRPLRDEHFEFRGGGQTGVGPGERPGREDR